MKVESRTILLFFHLFRKHTKKPPPPTPLSIPTAIILFFLFLLLSLFRVYGRNVSNSNKFFQLRCNSKRFTAHHATSSQPLSSAINVTYPMNSRLLIREREFFLSRSNTRFECVRVFFYSPSQHAHQPHNMSSSREGEKHLYICMNSIPSLIIM